MSRALEKILGWEPVKAAKVGGRLSLYFEEGRRFGLPAETLPSHIYSLERVAARLSGNPGSLTSLPIPSKLDNDQAWALADWALLYERELKESADKAMHQYWHLKTTAAISATRINSIVSKKGEIEHHIAVLLDDVGVSHGFVARWGFRFDPQGKLRAQALCDRTLPFPETVELYLCLCSSIASNDNKATNQERSAAARILTICRLGEKVTPVNVLAEKP